MITHYDLFSGIGGFAYSIDQVYGKEKTKHIFVESDPFCQAVLRKHWPNSEIHGDIRGFVADTERKRPHYKKDKQKLESKRGGELRIEQSRSIILTGGFPCQPFSQAGFRKGTSDDRYLWPEMFRVISEVKPEWVIVENVVGLLTIQNGLVFEQVRADLESQDYEVQSYVIPACAVGAPHRRDRVWIVAHNKRTGCGKRNRIRTRRVCYKKERSSARGESERFDWNENWLEVATRLCGMDDGLPRQMDGVAISGARHRKERLKACGNAIVPQVAMKILEGIKLYDLSK